MFSIQLTPLEAQAARVIATMRGVDVNTLICDLVREEATIVISDWRNTVAKAEPREKVQHEQQ